LSGAEGTPARGGGGRARWLAKRRARANEERGGRGARKQEREREYGGVVLGVALGVGLTVASKDDDDGGATLDVEDGAAVVRASSTRERRRRKKGTFSLGPSHSPGLKVFHQIMAPVQTP